VNLLWDERAQQLLYERETLRGKRASQGLSDDQKIQLTAVEAEYKIYSATVAERRSELVRQVRAVVQPYRQHASVFVGGVPMIAADMVSFVRSDLVLFGSTILGIMTIVLAVIFRRFRWVVIPLIDCIATATAMLGLLAALDWRMTVISSNFVAVLLITTLAIAIHLIVRFRELELSCPELSVHELVTRTVQQMVVPCIFTGITTIVAFVSLVVSGLQPVIDFGWMMTVGVVVALLFSFVLVPCMTLLLAQARGGEHRRAGGTLTAKVAAVTDRHGSAVLWSALVLALISVWGISRLQVENRFIDYFHPSTEIYQGMELLDARLGGTIPLDIILTPPQQQNVLPGLTATASNVETLPVDPDDPFASEQEDPFAAPPKYEDSEFEDDWGDDAGFAEEDSFVPSYWFTVEGMELLDSIHGYVNSLDETGKVLSLSTLYAVLRELLDGDVGAVELALVEKSLPASIRSMVVDPYFSAEQQQARITLRVMETSEQLRRDSFLKSLHRHLVEDLEVEEDSLAFTGMLVLYNNVLQSLFKSQILTLGTVFLAILVMFTLLFRSLALALIALAPNILAAGMVLGVMGLLAIPLDIMTITIAAIVVGIGVDNCIHYVYRFRREFDIDSNYTAAMYRSHGSIGNAMYYTTLTIMIGFSTLVLSNFTPSIYFGLLTVLAMAAAVIGALMLMPRLIMLVKPLGPEAL